MDKWYSLHRADVQHAAAELSMELALYDWGASPAMDLKAVRRLWPADPAHKVLIVLDGVDGAAIAWDDLPGDILQLVLHAVMMEDKKAPRVAAVKTSWAAAQWSVASTVFAAANISGGRRPFHHSCRISTTRGSTAPLASSGQSTLPIASDPPACVLSPLASLQVEAAARLARRPPPHPQAVC